jgi:hypothetical protein
MYVCMCMYISVWQDITTTSGTHLVATLKGNLYMTFKQVHLEQCAILYYTILYSAILNCIILYHRCTILHYMWTTSCMLYCTLLYDTVLYCTILCYPILSYPILS